MRNIYYNWIWILVVSAISCSKENQNVTLAGGNQQFMPCTEWTYSPSDVSSVQSEQYMQSSSDDDMLIYEYIGSEDITMSYLFVSDKLAASSIILENSSSNQKKIKELLLTYTQVGDKNGSPVYVNSAKTTAALLEISKAGNDKEYVSLAFAPYAPYEEEIDEDAPYVDLGLSVYWAKCNVEASAPEKGGGYYAWSETRTKSSYWRENYLFCNNDDNVYIFEYTNSYADISGTIYDVATKKLGEGWRMPTKQEALELIYSCTWERDYINDVAGAKVTGPNGQSIFIPNTGYKKQDKDPGSYTSLWTSEAISKTSEEAYAIVTSNNLNTEPELDIVWKAWGLPVRAVKDRN